MEALLRDDLTALGFNLNEDIIDIEIGCGCHNEYEIIKRIGRLRVRAQELAVKVYSCLRSRLRLTSSLEYGRRSSPFSYLHYRPEHLAIDLNA